MLKQENWVGQVLDGIYNIYTVRVDNRKFQCRIRGKILKEDEQYFNPIAVGDFVQIISDPLSEEIGWIIERKPRKSCLIRWNKKRKSPQAIAAMWTY